MGDDLVGLEGLFQRALQAMDQGLWQEATVHLDQALALDDQRLGLWFNRAWCRLQLGDLTGASDDLEALLLRQGDHAQAMALLGRVQLARGLLQEGAMSLTLAQRLAPDDQVLAQQAVRAWLVVPDAVTRALDVAMEAAGRGLLDQDLALELVPFVRELPDGDSVLRDWLRQLCQLPKAHLRDWMFEGWSACCSAAFNHTEAAVAARLWLQHDPDAPPALDALIRALAGRGDFDAALPLAVERARKYPSQMAPMRELVQHLFSCMDTPSRMASVTILCHAISREPDNPMLWCLRGEINARLFIKQDAASDFRKALSLDPQCKLAVVGLSETLAQEGLYDPALDLLRNHAWDEEDKGLVIASMGNILRFAGRLQEAQQMLQHLWLTTGNPSAAVNLAFCLLSQGDYPRGFEMFRQRRSAAQQARVWHQAQHLGAKPWEGDLGVLAGKHVLVTTENGIGDTFQFARFLPQLIAHSAHVTVAAQARTENLIRSVHPRLRVVSDAGPLPLADWVCDIMDMPGLLGARLDRPETLGQACCLQVDPQVLARVRERMGPAKGLRVALGWRGTRASMAERSIELALFAQCQWPGIEWFSLQYGELLPEDQAAARQMGMRQEDWTFDETAAAMTLMDAVVTIDTVYAHLAGALGLSPVVLLNALVDWRWQDMGGANAWYPQAQLLRAAALDDWPPVIRQVQRLLLEKAAAMPPVEMAPVTVVVPPTPGLADWCVRFDQAQAQQDWLPATQAVLQGLRQGGDAHRLLQAITLLIPHLEDTDVLIPALMERLSDVPPDEAWPLEPMKALGLVLLESRRHVDACRLLLLAAQRAPDDPWSWIHLARAHELANDAPACLRAAQRALALSPSLAGARRVYFMGLLLTARLQEALAEAESMLRQARVSRSPEDLIEALICRAQVLQAQGLLPLAERDMREVVAIDPQARARILLGELLAQQGAYAEAAGLILSRLEHKTRVSGNMQTWQQAGAVEWTQGPLSQWQGRQLVVLAENGAGDTFQMGRFLLPMARQGVRITLCAPAHVHGVMSCVAAQARSEGLEIVLVGLDAALDTPDAFVLLETLPWLLGVKLDNLHEWGAAHYLQTDPQRVAGLAQRWAWPRPAPRLRVGLAWLGQLNGNGVRRTRLLDVADAFEAEGLLGKIDLYGLPLEALTDEELPAAQRLGMTHPQWSFADEAAALVQMDLVISVDTSHAHLAGALGVPCWVLLKFVPDWRWGMGADHTPWYPHARLFRQQQPDDWRQPLKEVARQLRQMVHGC